MDSEISQEKREKGKIGKAILTSSVIAMVMITTLNVLTGREDLINALEIAIKVVPFVVLWTFLLISFFDKNFLFDEDREYQDDIIALWEAE
ncbi:hypothetical protein [Thermococcus sp. MAR1]|uniref:hypothetical protein n=1 Tax=Thermococcus sp. MAR1 TaxID=1638263 RepID=UPI001439A3B9|nr:hypothetical protein [Thermococcus sp. MAR1]NJE10908.1 hypothetical protein [Thermococcus sp. MAR1]